MIDSPRSTGVGLGVDMIGFNILRKSDTLNRFVNWVSGARINRDTLSQRILQRAFDIGEYAFASKKKLGDRRATLVPLIRTAVTSADQSAVEQAVRQLTQDRMGAMLGTGKSGIQHTFADLLSQATSTVAGKLTGRYLGDHIGQKVLATMIARHGWEPLNKMMAWSMGNIPGRGALMDQIRTVLQYAVIDRPNMNQSDSAEYRLLADVAKVYMTTNSSAEMQQCVEAYAPKTAAVITGISAAKEAVVSGISAAKEAVVTGVEWAQAAMTEAKQYASELPLRIVDAAQIAVGIVVQPVSMEDAYADAIAQAAATRGNAGTSTGIAAGESMASVSALENPIPVSIKATTTERDTADDYLRSWAVAGSGAGVTNDARFTESEAASIAQMAMRLRMDDVTSETVVPIQAAHRVMDLLSMEQIAPWADRHSVDVVRTLSDRLSEIQTTSHHFLDGGISQSQGWETHFRSAPNDTVLLDGHRIGRGCATQLAGLNIDMPEGVKSYGDLAADVGGAMFNIGQQLFNYSPWGSPLPPADKPVPAQSIKLQQLYEVCGRSPAMLETITHFLDEDRLQAALRSTGADRLQPSTSLPVPNNSSGSSIVIAADGAFLKVDQGKMDIRYIIRSDAERVTLSIETRQRITAFGTTPDALRQPHDSADDSVLVATHLITIPRATGSTASVPLNAEHTPMGVLASIKNRFAFDTNTGAMTSLSV